MSKETTASNNHLLLTSISNFYTHRTCCVAFFGTVSMVEIIQSALGLLAMTILCAASYLFWNWYSHRDKTPDYTLSLDGNGGGDGFINENEDKSEVLEKLFSKNGNAEVLSGETDVYNWNQTEKEVELYVPVTATVKGKDINCKIRSNNMILTVNGEVLINGDFYATVVPDECNWQIGLDILFLPSWSLTYASYDSLLRWRWRSKESMD